MVLSIGLLAAVLALQAAAFADEGFWARLECPAAVIVGDEGGGFMVSVVMPEKYADKAIVEVYAAAPSGQLDVRLGGIASMGGGLAARFYYVENVAADAGLVIVISSVTLPQGSGVYEHVDTCPVSIIDLRKLGGGVAGVVDALVAPRLAERLSDAVEKAYAESAAAETARVLKALEQVRAEALGALGNSTLEVKQAIRGEAAGVIAALDNRTAALRASIASAVKVVNETSERMNQTLKDIKKNVNVFSTVNIQLVTMVSTAAMIAILALTAGLAQGGRPGLLVTGALVILSLILGYMLGSGALQSLLRDLVGRLSGA